MTTSDTLRTYAEMVAAGEFVEYLAQLLSGDLDGGDPGVNVPLQRLARGMDALVDTLQGTKGMYITGGGTITWAGGSLTRTAQMDFNFPHEIGTASKNILNAGSVALGAAGTVAYVRFDRDTDSAPVNVLTEATMADFIAMVTGDHARLDFHIIAYRDGNDLILWDGRRLRAGFSYTNNGFTDTQYAQQSEMDVVHPNQKENFQMLLTGGGTISWDEDTGTFSWAAPLYVEYPADAGVNRLVAGSAVIAAGQVAYMTLSRDPAGVVDIAVTVVANGSVPDSDNAFVLATHHPIDGRLYLWNGMALSDGESVLLGGVRAGLEWFYKGDGTGTQVLDLSASGEYVIGNGDLMVYFNGVKARCSTAYWSGVYPAGSLIGALDDRDRYVEEDPDGNGRGTRVIWLADGQAAAEPLYHAASAHAPSVPWTWPDVADSLEAFVGLQGEGPSPLEYLGIFGEPGDPLTGEVYLEAGAGVTLSYNPGNNSIVFEFDPYEAVVSSLAVDGGDARQGAIDLTSGSLITIVEVSPTEFRFDVEVALDDLSDMDEDLADAIFAAGSSPLVTYPPTAGNMLATLKDVYRATGYVLGNMSQVGGFDVIRFTPSWVRVSPGYCYDGDGQICLQAGQRKNIGPGHIVGGDSVLPSTWHYVYVSDGGDTTVGGHLSNTGPDATGLHPDEPGGISMRCVASVYVKADGSFAWGVKRGSEYVLTDPVSLGITLSVGSTNTLSTLTSYLPETDTSCPKFRIMYRFSAGYIPIPYIRYREDSSSDWKTLYLTYSDAEYGTIEFEVAADDPNAIQLGFAGLDSIESFELIGFTEGLSSIGGYWS